MKPLHVALARYIDDVTRASGSPPTYAQMAAAIGVKHRSRVYRLLEDLESSGFIRRGFRLRQSVEIISLPVADDDHRRLVEAAPALLEACKETHAVLTGMLSGKMVPNQQLQGAAFLAEQAIGQASGAQVRA